MTTDDQPDRLTCRRCGCAHLPVVYTRHRRNLTIRVRVCRYCGHRMVSHERLVGTQAETPPLAAPPQPPGGPGKPAKPRGRKARRAKRPRK